MVIFLQYTLTDQRSFTDINSSLLKKPAWPSPYPFKEFVKGSGQIIERKSGGMDNWIGENYICKINKGIKIPNIEITDPKVILKNTSKHQYSTESGILTEYEFVFEVTGKKQLVTKSIIEEIIDKLLNAEISIRNIAFKYSKSKLRTINKGLKEFHILTTTKKKEVDIDNDLKYLNFCTPQLYFFLKSKEKLDVSKNGMKKITKSDEFPFHLFSYLKNINNSPYRVWIHHEKFINSLSVEINRDLRISLLRIHSEYECLNNVFRNITNGLIKVNERTTESDKLQFYISNTITSITKQKSNVENGIGQTDSIEYFKDIFYETKPGDYAMLISKVKQFNFRPQIEQKTVNFINNIEIMENKYKIENSQVAAIGDNAKADNNQFQQTNYTIPKDLDYDKLINELNELKNHVASQEDLQHKDDAITNIEEAKKEAANKNGNGVVKYLKMGGTWLFETATKIGISVVTELLKNNLGK